MVNNFYNVIQKNLLMSNNYINTKSSLSMKGEGYYSAKTARAKNAIDKTQKVIENALKTIPTKEILRFADYGSADGGTSQKNVE